MELVTSSCALLLMLMMTSSLCDAQNSISEGPAADGKTLSLYLYACVFVCSYVCVCVCVCVCQRVQ